VGENDEPNPGREGGDAYDNEKDKDGWVCLRGGVVQDQTGKKDDAITQEEVSAHPEISRSTGDLDTHRCDNNSLMIRE
jgi:hypothetical protein